MLCEIGSSKVKLPKVGSNVMIVHVPVGARPNKPKKQTNNLLQMTFFNRSMFNL
jgi:hypothetical protein